MSFTVKKKWFWESTERNLKPDWAFAPSRFEGVAIHEHFLPKACFSTQRGESVRKHAALMAINGSLTENHVETQRAQHAQASPNVKTSKPFAIKPIANSKCETWVKAYHAARTFPEIVAEWGCSGACYGTTFLRVYKKPDLQYTKVMQPNRKNLYISVCRINLSDAQPFSAAVNGQRGQYNRNFIIFFHYFLPRYRHFY